MRVLAPDPVDVFCVADRGLIVDDPLLDLERGSLDTSRQVSGSGIEGQALHAQRLRTGSQAGKDVQRVASGPHTVRKTFGDGRNERNRRSGLET